MELMSAREIQVIKALPANSCRLPSLSAKKTEQLLNNEIP